MDIIVDGYNLIRHSETLRRFEKQSLEAGRRALARRVALYTARKDHRVTIVFDGKEGISPEEERDVLSGVLIVYSRRGETADEVIKRMVKKAKEETIVVTSDRNLADYVAHHGAATISSDEFDTRVEMSRMPLAATGGGEDDSEERRLAKSTKKKGAARRLSRREKTALTRIKKL